MPVSTFKTLLACLLTLICAVGLWAAYDWFQGRYIRAFSDQTALFAGDVLSLPAELSGPGAIRVVHFWDPACPCNVGNQQHLSELLAHYVPQGVEFYSLQKAGTQGQLPATLGAIKPLASLPGAERTSGRVVPGDAALPGCCGRRRRHPGSSGAVLRTAGDRPEQAESRRGDGLLAELRLRGALPGHVAGGLCSCRFFGNPQRVAVWSH